METQSLVPSNTIKEEPDYEDEKVKEEPCGEKGSNHVHVIKTTRTNSLSPFCSDEDSVLYCENCQMKYEGGCPMHGLLVYIDNAETGQGESCSQDSSHLFNKVDKSHVSRKEEVEKFIFAMAHDDNVGTLPNGDSGTELDQMFSVCEVNTKLCVDGINYGGQDNVENKTRKKEYKIMKPFSCDVCGVEFTFCSQLERHKKIHTDKKPYKCEMCGVGIATKRYLKEHKTRHTGERKYKCDLCGAGFATKSHINYHIKTHAHDKSYKCDVCGLGLVTSGQLKSHKRTHTGEKPYKCEVCGVGFAQNESLKRHKRRHTGEKPYKCDVCGARFTQNGSLKIHMKIHVGGKPYIGDVHDVGFTSNGTLKSHKIQRRPKKKFTKYHTEIINVLVL